MKVIYIYIIGKGMKVKKQYRSDTVKVWDQVKINGGQAGLRQNNTYNTGRYDWGQVQFMTYTSPISRPGFS